VDPKNDITLVASLLLHIVDTLKGKGVEFYIDEKSPEDCPEIILSEGRKIVIGQYEILYVFGVNKFLNDYKYDLFCVTDGINGVKEWITERL
jgi:hypothetical protein